MNDWIKAIILGTVTLIAVFAVPLVVSFLAAILTGMVMLVGLVLGVWVLLQILKDDDPPDEPLP